MQTAYHAYEYLGIQYCPNRVQYLPAIWKLLLNRRRMAPNWLLSAPEDIERDSEDIRCRFLDQCAIVKQLVIGD